MRDSPNQQVSEVSLLPLLEKCFEVVQCESPVLVPCGCLGDLPKALKQMSFDDSRDGGPKHRSLQPLFGLKCLIVEFHFLLPCEPHTASAHLKFEQCCRTQSLAEVREENLECSKSCLLLALVLSAVTQTLHDCQGMRSARQSRYHVLLVEILI